MYGASYTAFAAGSFSVCISPNTDTFDTDFVLGKERVAPLELHTITKVELQRAVPGMRIANLVKRESTLPNKQNIFCPILQNSQKMG